MKMILPDGAVVEGTPEEISQLIGPVGPAGPTERWPTPHYERPPMWTLPQHAPTCEITSAMRGWLSVIPPKCTCGAAVEQPFDLTVT